MARGEQLTRLLPGFSLQRGLIVTALFIVAYSGSTVVGNVAHRHELDVQTQQLNQDIARDQANYQKLDALRRYLQSDQFIESSAREDDGLSRPGDTVIVVSSPPSSPSDTQSSSGQWWDRYYNP